MYTHTYTDKIVRKEILSKNNQMSSSYFEQYAHVFFGLNPDVELFKLKPHKRSWILQSVKRFGDFYFRKYNNREVIQLIRQIIERYDLNKNLDMKDKIYLVGPNRIDNKIKTFLKYLGILDL